MLDDHRPALAALDIPTPDAVTSAHDTYGALLEASHADLEFDVNAIADADDLRAKLADYAHRVATRDAARGVASAVEAECQRRLVAAWREHAPAVLAQVAGLARPAADTVTTAAEHVGPNDTAASILAKGGEALEVWRDPTRLLEPAIMLDDCTRAVQALARYVGGKRQPLAPWFVDVATRTQLEDAGRRWDTKATADHPGGRWLALAAAGHTLAPVDAEGYAARLAELGKHDAAEAARAKEERDRHNPELERDRRTLRAYSRQLAG